MGRWLQFKYVFPIRRDKCSTKKPSITSNFGDVRPLYDGVEWFCLGLKVTWEIKRIHRNPKDSLDLSVWHVYHFWFNSYCTSQWLKCRKDGSQIGCMHILQTSKTDMTTLRNVQHIVKVLILFTFHSYLGNYFIFRMWSICTHNVGV